jgi:dynein light chain 1
MIGNPLEEKSTADGNYRTEMALKFPVLKKLDGKPIIRDEVEEGGEEKSTG